MRVSLLVSMKRAQGYTLEEVNTVAFPHLDMDQILAALTYYGKHQKQIEAELEEEHRLFEELRAKSDQPARSALKKRLQELQSA